MPCTHGYRTHSKTTISGLGNTKEVLDFGDDDRPGDELRTADQVTPQFVAARLVPLCAAAEIGEGSARGFDPFGSGADTLFAVRHRGRLYAWRDACPHVPGAPMAWRRHQYLNREGSRIVCSAHGAQFDIVSGACTLGPCLGQSLEPVAIACGSDGVLYLVADPLPHSS